MHCFCPIPHCNPPGQAHNFWALWHPIPSALMQLLWNSIPPIDACHPLHYWGLCLYFHCITSQCKKKGPHVGIQPSSPSRQTACTFGRVTLGQCVCVCVVCFLESIMVSPYNRALFSNHRLYKAISSPYSHSFLEIMSVLSSKHKRKRNQKCPKRVSPIAQNPWGTKTNKQTEKGRKEKCFSSPKKEICTKSNHRHWTTYSLPNASINPT